jgi:hypothetical protein
MRWEASAKCSSPSSTTPISCRPSASASRRSGQSPKTIAVYDQSMAIRSKSTTAKGSAIRAADPLPIRVVLVVLRRLIFQLVFCFFRCSERPASPGRRAAMAQNWRAKRRPDGPRSSPHGVNHGRAYKQHQHTTPARKVVLTGVAPRFSRPRARCRVSLAFEV